MVSRWKEDSFSFSFACLSIFSDLQWVCVTFVIRGKHSHHCNSLVVRVRNSAQSYLKKKNAINVHLWLKIWQWILFQAWLKVHMRSWGSCSIPILSLLGVYWSTGKVRIRGCIHGSKWPELLYNAEEGEPSKGLWEEEAAELGLK